MNIKELSDKVSADLEASGYYKSRYRFKRISFWMENFTMLFCAFMLWTLVAQEFNLSTPMLCGLYVLMSMLVIWPCYTMDTSPQSPVEIKNELHESILGHLVKYALDQNLLDETGRIRENAQEVESDAA